MKKVAKNKCIILYFIKIFFIDYFKIYNNIQILADITFRLVSITLKIKKNSPVKLIYHKLYILIY